MDPFAYIFDAAATLTGGIVTDLKTAFLGMLVIMFILMGLDLLIGVIDNLTQSFSHKRSTGIARNLRDERDSYTKNSFDYEYYDLAYRKNLRSSMDSFKDSDFK